MNQTKYYKEKVWLLFFLLFAVCTSMLFTKVIPQDPNYHHFADDRTISDIPNFWNVFSNLPFLIIGIAGVYYLIRQKNYLKLKSLGINYIAFFVGIFLIGIGSANYHLNPTNNTIVCDRIPMTISFMSFFSIIIGEYIHQQIGKKLLFPLVIIGIISVMYWHYSEITGNGDLRLYFVVQFFPMILIPLIILMFKQKSQSVVNTWLVLLAYLLAKTFEVFDLVVFQATTQISGHTIKHFFAALAPLLLLHATTNKIKFDIHNFRIFKL